MIKEKFGFDRFERAKNTFFKRHGWRFMPFAQRDPLPNPRLLVPHQVGEVNKLLDLVREGDLVTFVTSGVGLGKTALCRFLAETLPAEYPNTVTVFVHAPSVETPEQMLRLILTRLELEFKEGDVTAEFEQFYRWHENFPDLQLVLILDEFPDLDARTGEMIRTLADLRGVSWVLNGQRGPLLRFIEREVPALLQRRRIMLDLKPMSTDEVRELLALRMAWARGDDYDHLPIAPFTSTAIEKIHRVSRGIPRDALKAAGDAVYLAIERGSPKIDPKMVRGAAGPRRRIAKIREGKAKPRRKFLGFLGLRR